jgi:hypothetical protein
MTTVLPRPTRTGTAVLADRLNRVSARRVVEPDHELPWGTLGDAQVVPDELLSVAGLDLDLSAPQRARLAREEVASMLTAGIRFEAALDTAFSWLVFVAEQHRDPRIVYMLHEVGEETRHQRAFIRLLDELDASAPNRLAHPLLRRVMRLQVRSLLHQPAMLMVMVLAGEEIPDLLQRLASEHPGTAPLLAAVNRYHRQEEARHLSFARAVLPELWARAGRVERWRVHHAAPRMIRVLFATMVQPGVYETVGLPAWDTWRAVQRAPARIALRHHATRPVVRALLDAGVLAPGHVPKGWRGLCGVDRFGRPLPDVAPLPGRPADA